jgi:hypothetical protein
VLTLSNATFRWASTPRGSDDDDDDDGTDNGKGKDNKDSGVAEGRGKEGGGHVDHGKNHDKNNGVGGKDKSKGKSGGVGSDGVGSDGGGPASQPRSSERSWTGQSRRGSSTQQPELAIQGVSFEAKPGDLIVVAGEVSFN